MTTPAPGKAELDRSGWLQTEHIADDAITADKIADDAVTTDLIIDDAITAAKADLFQSETKTGTGSASPTAHGLTASPSIVQVSIMSVSATPATVSATSNATNIYVTADTDTTYQAIAWV